jgi:hypothetical protein
MHYTRLAHTHAQMYSLLFAFVFASQDCDQIFGCLATHLSKCNCHDREQLLRLLQACFHPSDGCPVYPSHLDRVTNWRQWCIDLEFYEYNTTFKNMHTNGFRKFLFKRGIDGEGMENVSCQVKTLDLESIAYT